MPEARIWSEDGVKDTTKYVSNILLSLKKRLLSTTKVLTTLGRRVEPNFCANEVPTFLDVLVKAGKLEVVNVHGQNKFEAFLHE